MENLSRVDPELFGWSLDFVGDLAETVALIWPEPSPSPHPNPPPLAGEEDDGRCRAPSPAGGGGLGWGQSDGSNSTTAGSPAVVRLSVFDPAKAAHVSVHAGK